MSRLSASRDGEPRATIRVEHRLDLGQIAAIIAQADETDLGFEPSRAPIGEIRTQVQRRLVSEGVTAADFVEPDEVHVAAARRAYGTPGV